MHQMQKKGDQSIKQPGLICEQLLRCITIVSTLINQLTLCSQLFRFLGENCSSLFQ